MIVVYSAEALADLDEIWDWNSTHFGDDRADEYIDFLKVGIDALATTHGFGRRVRTATHLRYITIVKRRNRHGHVAVYSVIGTTVNLIHVFGTAQDWQQKLKP